MASFNIEEFIKYPSTYQATEDIIAQIRCQNGIQTYTEKNIEYLFNEEKQTAVMLKSIARKTTKLGEGKNKKCEVKPDIGHRITTVSNGISAIRRFFKMFPTYHLVVSSGCLEHECCVFFRKEGGKFKSIYFNPNFSDVQDGVESSTMVTKIFKTLGRALVEKKSFFAMCGNVDGNCSAHTWEKIYKHVCDGASPFNDDSLDLQEYSHNMTTQTYNRYKTKSIQRKRGKETLHHLKMWKQLDSKMIDVDGRDAFRIMGKISQMISDLKIQTTK